MVYDLGKTNQAIQAFREDYAVRQAIPRSLLEYLHINVRLDPMGTALLKSCHLERTSKVKKLRVEFQIELALQLYEAVPFEQLRSDSDICLIVYAGPKHIIYDSYDQTFRPLSNVTNSLPSPYRDVRLLFEKEHPKHLRGSEGGVL